MIWFRRTAAFTLALLAVLLFVLGLVVLRAENTLGNPDFYNEQLLQADSYNFVYDDILPAVLEEAEIGGGTSEGGVDISRLKPHIISMAEQTVPRDWLQAQVEQVINETVPYVWGSREGFTVNIPLKDRVEAAARATRDTLHKEDVFPLLYEQVTALAVDEFAGSAEELPPPFALNKSELEAVVQTVLPAEWMLGQLDGAIDEVVPYFTGDSEQFRIQVDISYQVDSLEAILIDILRRPETYDYLFEEVVAPAIKENTREITRLPIGIELTDEEILQATREVLPLEWYQARVTDIVGQMFSYLRGTRQTMEVVIPLAERKPAVVDTLSELADRKLENLIDSLPPCTSSELLDMLSEPSSGSLPACRPLDISYAELKELLGIDAADAVAPLVDVSLPDQWTFTDADLRQALGGEDDGNVLDQMREVVQEGFIYTSEDLRADLGEDYRTVEDIRQQIAGGFVFTEAELLELMGGDGGGSGGGQLQTFHEVRSWLGMVKDWKAVALLFPVLLVLSVGLLGGRKWSSKLIWAAALLTVIAIVTYAVFGPVFSAMAQPRIDGALVQLTAQPDGIQALVADKGATLAQNAVDSFIGGIRVQAFIILGVSLALVVVGSLWHFWFGKNRA